MSAGADLSTSEILPRPCRERQTSGADENMGSAAKHRAVHLQPAAVHCTVETFGPAFNGCQWGNHTWGFSSRLKQNLFEDEELTRMELFYDTSKFLYDSLQVVIKEETQILKMVLVGLTTSLVTISTLSYDRVGGPQCRGCTNCGPVLMATASGTLAAAYTSFFQ